MITTIEGHTIELDGTTEWLLFHRLSKIQNPVDFLFLTDSLIQYPNFLFTISLIATNFINTNIFIKLSVPAVLFFFGQMAINFKFGLGDLRILKYPLKYFARLYLLIMPATFFASFVFLKWKAFLIIPIYIFMYIFTLIMLTNKQKRLYKSIMITRANYEVFTNNAFICVYRLLADKYNLTKELSPTDNEIQNRDWEKPYQYMRQNWIQIESYFSERAKKYWTAYLNLDKKPNSES